MSGATGVGRLVWNQGLGTQGGTTDGFWSEVVRFAPVIAAATATLMLLFAVLTFRIVAARERRERQADQLEDPDAQQAAIDQAEASLQFLRDVLWAIVSDLKNIIELRAPFDPQERYSLVVDASLFQLPQQYERHQRLLAELVWHVEEAAEHAAAIRQRLRTLVKAGWRLKPKDVMPALSRVEYLMQRLASLESIHPGDAIQFAMEAHDAVAAIVKAPPNLPPP
jgi:hypothetical protein